MLLVSGYSRVVVTLQVDMYSFGVILWQLITTEVARRGRLRAIQVGTAAELPNSLHPMLSAHTVWSL